MTIASLLFFIIMYSVLALTILEPDYFKALIFAVPFILFGAITLLTIKNVIKENASILSTGILIIPLAIAMLVALFNYSITCAATTTANISHYERALKLSHFPNQLSETFPDKIPSNAKNVNFMYHPALGQGGQEIALKFETDPDSIKSYIEEFSKKAKWIGKERDKDANKYGVIVGQFFQFEYANSGLPKDYIVYVIYSEPYREGDWNHGEVSLVAISEQSNEVFFRAEKW